MTVLVESVADAVESIRDAADRLWEARECVTEEQKSRIAMLAMELLTFARFSGDPEQAPWLKEDEDAEDDR